MLTRATRAYFKVGLVVALRRVAIHYTDTYPIHIMYTLPTNWKLRFEKIKSRDEMYAEVNNICISTASERERVRIYALYIYNIIIIVDCCILYTIHMYVYSARYT